jgi:hypothetical protein
MGEGRRPNIVWSRRPPLRFFQGGLARGGLGGSDLSRQRRRVGAAHTYRGADSKHFSMEKSMDVMSKLTQQRLTNARKPTGRLGRLLTRAMNIRHYPMTNWGW